MNPATEPSLQPLCLGFSPGILRRLEGPDSIELSSDPACAHTPHTDTITIIIIT